MATPKIDAYLNQVGYGATAEEKARHIGDTPELLEEALRDMVEVLREDLRKAFKGARFEFSGKRLVAKNGSDALIWSMRQYPDKPIAYRNQQSSLGRVTHALLGGSLDRHR